MRWTFIFSLLLHLNKPVFRDSRLTHDWCHQDCLNLLKNSISGSTSSESILSATSNEEFLHSGTVKATTIRRINPNLYLYLTLLFDHAITLSTKKRCRYRFFFFLFLNKWWGRSKSDVQSQNSRAPTCRGMFLLDQYHFCL